MIKILHAADFHLDSAFSALLPELAVMRRQEQRLVLEQLRALCDESDLVLLPGDLFDSAHIYRDTLDALKQFFASVKAQIFIAPGNHDYLTDGSPYLTEDWGENVHIYTSPEISCVHLDGCDVYGAAFTAPECPPLLQGFRVENPDTVNIMLLHGDLQANSVYNPISAEDISASGLNYLALGHIHLRDEKRFGRTTCAWPGCLMGRGFDECGEKGVLQVEVSKGASNVCFVPLDVRRYEILRVVAGENARASVCAALPEQTQRDCYRIVLTGEAENVDAKALEEELKDRFYSLSVRDATVPKQALWASAGEDTLRGHFLQDLKMQYEQAPEEDRKRKIAAAAKLVTALMDGREAAL